MRNRTYAVLFPLFAVASAASSAAIPLAPARAAATCIAKPDRPASQGQHWYFRRDPATRRRCWYLGAQTMRSRALAIRLHRGATTGANPGAAEPSAPPSPIPPSDTAPARPAEAAHVEPGDREIALLAQGPDTAGLRRQVPDTAGLQREVPDTAGLRREEPSPAPIATVSATDAQRLAGLIAPTVPDVEPTPALPWSARPGPSETVRAAEPSPAKPSPALAREPEHVFAVIMTALALLAIAGPVWHMEGWRRRRERRRRTSGRALPRWSAVPSPISAPAPLDQQGTAAALHCPFPARSESFDWSQQFAVAWEELSEDADFREMRHLSAQSA